MIKLIFAATLLAAYSAQAQEGRQNVIRALCHKDGCDEFTVRNIEPGGDVGDGQLFSFWLHAYKASRSGRADMGEQRGYAYCSRTRPALINQRDNQVGAVLLAPFSRERRDQIRLNANYSAIYFTVCHGPDAGKQASVGVAGVARQYGYNVRRDAFRLTQLKSPEDAADQE